VLLHSYELGPPDGPHVHGGHSVHWDAFAETSAAIDAFLAR
jgi:hypothetical protein